MINPGMEWATLPYVDWEEHESTAMMPPHKLHPMPSGKQHIIWNPTICNFPRETLGIYLYPCQKSSRGALQRWPKAASKSGTSDQARSQWFQGV